MVLDEEIVPLCLSYVYYVYQNVVTQLHSLVIHNPHSWAALREKVLNSLIRCHTKRKEGAAPHAGPSFGMTTTQDIRNLFA